LVAETNDVSTEIVHSRWTGAVEHVIPARCRGVNELELRVLMAATFGGHDQALLFTGTIDDSEAHDCQSWCGGRA